MPQSLHFFARHIRRHRRSGKTHFFEMRHILKCDAECLTLTGQDMSIIFIRDLTSFGKSSFAVRDFPDCLT